MDYRVLIFMTNDRLTAMDIGPDDVPDTISIYGNEAVNYASEVQIEEFCDLIKEYYNMERFSDRRMEISILRFDAAMEDAFCLLNILQKEGISKCNLVSAEKFLPWIAVKEGVLKVGTAVQIKAFDQIYTVTLDNDRKLTCQCGETGEVQPFIVTKEEIARYNYISKNALSGGEEEKNEYEKALKEKECERARLEKWLEVEIKKRQEAETNLAKIRTAIEAVLKEKQYNANRHICYLRCSDKKRDILYTGNEYYNYSIKFCCRTGDIISKDMKIAEVTVKGIPFMILGCVVNVSDEGEGEFSIMAKTGGRLFWLQETISKEIRYGDAIAVIGDESDTKADVLNWYEKNK